METRPIVGLISGLPWVPQHQGSTLEQLLLLRSAAIKLGLYDADDVLAKLINKSHLSHSISK